MDLNKIIGSVTVAEVPVMKDSDLVEVLFYKDPSLGFGVSSTFLDKNEWQWLTGEDVIFYPQDYVLAVARRLRDGVVPGLSVVAVYDDNGEFDDSFIVTLFSEESDIGVSRKMSVKDIALDSDDVIIAVPIARAILSLLAPFGGG